METRLRVRDWKGLKMRIGKTRQGGRIVALLEILGEEYNHTLANSACC